MNQEEHIDYWFNLADDDFIVAESNFKNGHYLWCLFICHLILEKSLKALYVKVTNETPPKIHDLIKLSRFINIKISEHDLLFFNDMNRFNIEARYPDIKNSLNLIATKEFTKERLIKTGEMLKWLKSQRN